MMWAVMRWLHLLSCLIIPASFGNAKVQGRQPTCSTPGARTGSCSISTGIGANHCSVLPWVSALTLTAAELPLRLATDATRSSGWSPGLSSGSKVML